MAMRFCPPRILIRLCEGAVVCLIGQAAMADAGLSLLNHRLGEAHADLADAADFLCAPASEVPSTLLCRAQSPTRFVIATVKLEALSLHYFEGRLRAVDVRFPESGFGDVTKFLTDTFGTSRAEPEKLRGGMGGYFENAIHVWEAGDDSLRAEQFVGSINTSSLLLAGKHDIAGLIVPKRVDPASGLKDL